MLKVGIDGDWRKALVDVIPARKYKFQQNLGRSTPLESDSTADQAATNDSMPPPLSTTIRDSGPAATADSSIAATADSSLATVDSSTASSTDHQ
jgi:hypothetical protein